MATLEQLTAMDRYLSNAECGVRSAESAKEECGVQSAECGVGSEELRRAELAGAADGSAESDAGYRILDAGQKCEPASTQFPQPAAGFKATIEVDLASGHFSMHFRPADEAGGRSGTGQAAPAGPREPGPEERSIAAKVLQLLHALDPDKHLRKAQPLKVFLLRYRQNLSRREIARTCECDKSLVALRLRAIRDKLPWEPRLLRELSAVVEAMEAALEDSRARRIYRKGAVYGEEDDGENSD